ncbi:hypothetical protein [Leifsonia poae]|uniref:hypothetical protein n=1 Tax=Leifsonia poae TaxID=110933 RepID=UPI0022F2508B|nr:hypothetical protein [Leifsonia poae]
MNMQGFLNWISIGALPLASASIAFVALLMLDHNASESSRRDGARAIIITGVIALVCSLYLAGAPVIQPMWLQYLILIGGAFCVGILIHLLVSRLFGRPSE